MPAHQKDPLHSLTACERLSVKQVSRLHNAPGPEAAEAREVRGVADGRSFEAKFHLAG